MQSESTGKPIKLWTPATYRIEVEGYVDESWSDRLGDLRISIRKRKDRSVVTTLGGRLTDQAALLGVLNSLYDLHLPLLAVERQDLLETSE